jgi:hypothetical protein
MNEIHIEVWVNKALVGLHPETTGVVDADKGGWVSLTLTDAKAFAAWAVATAAEEGTEAAIARILKATAERIERDIVAQPQWLAELVEAVRTDDKVGRGSCSAIDECYSDDELAAWLTVRRICTPKKAVAEARADQALFEERQREMDGEAGITVKAPRPRKTARKKTNA